jgi:hypothetical protein
MKEHHIDCLFPVVPFAAAAAAHSKSWRERMRAENRAQNPRVTVASSPQVAAVIARSHEWRARANSATAL